MNLLLLMQQVGIQPLEKRTDGFHVFGLVTSVALDFRRELACLVDSIITRPGDT